MTTQPDARDAEAVKAIAASVTGLVRAVYDGDRLRIVGELGLLLTAIVEHRDSLAERPDDEALRRAVARLG